MAKEKVEYSPAPEVEQLATDLIAKYHTHIIDFGVNVRYTFVNKTPKSKGLEVWGTCRKISGLNAYHAGADDSFFGITISKEVWDILPEKSRLALVDHELCHIAAEMKEGKDEADEELEQETPVKLSVRPHDLEEFSCIVRRHGLWRDEIKDFVDAALSKKEEDAQGHGGAL
jgi:hypothetical protein